MRIFSPDGENVWLDADDLQDAIELQSLSTFSFADKVGIRLEVNRNQHFRACIPARPPLPSRPRFADFEHWWALWDTTKDPEKKRICSIAWRAALAYANAADDPEPRDTGVPKGL